MRTFAKAFLLFAVGFGLHGSHVRATAQATTYRLQYAPAPVDNPLKGLVPYAGDVSVRFPHSLEFNYLPLSALVVGENRYDWQPLEKLLDEIAGRGHQAVFRVFLEYPNHKDVIPKYLLEQGLKVHQYLNTNTQPFPPAQVETPDYNNPKLRTALQAFIQALGKKYDGDARIGFITAGLLGTWGEWHTYPRSELFASKTVQTEVMDAYAQAFHKTPILLRYPAGKDDGTYADNHALQLGYHDDSFAWSTLDTGKKGDEWFYLSKLKLAGIEAQNRWKTSPIGGEIRPEAWGKVFDEKPDVPEIQDFRTCVDQTHATWLMDSGMFKEQASEQRRKRAEEQVRRMGYEFHISKVTLNRKQKGRIEAQIDIENRGVAPFYYDWRGKYLLIDAKGRVVHTFEGNGKLVGLLPGAAARVWNEIFDVGKLPSGTYKLLLHIPNPLPKGNPLRFANATQDADIKGAVTLVPALSLP